MTNPSFPLKAEAKLHAADKDGLGHLLFQSTGQLSNIFIINNKPDIYVTESETHLTAMVRNMGTS